MKKTVRITVESCPLRVLKVFAIIFSISVIPVLAVPMLLFYSSLSNVLLMLIAYFLIIRFKNLLFNLNYL